MSTVLRFGSAKRLKDVKGVKVVGSKRLSWSSTAFCSKFLPVSSGLFSIILK